MLISFNRAKGHSMEPIIMNGSFFIASDIPYRLKSPKIDDVIIFKNNNKVIIKKISKISNKKYYIDGENKDDSMNFSPITKNKILAKVVFKF